MMQDGTREADAPPTETHIDDTPTRPTPGLERAGRLKTNLHRRAEDIEDVRARNEAWGEFQRRPAEDRSPFQAFMDALTVYIDAKTLTALRRQLNGR